LSKVGSAEKLGEDLRKALDQLGIGECAARVTISCSSATICEAEVPRMPIGEVRAAFKLPANSMRYLRRDVSGFCLDAVELVDPAKEEAGKKSPMMRVLIAAAPREDVLWCRDALAGAKIKAETLELAAISVVNAFELNRPNGEQRDACVLVDVGAQSTSINCVRSGRLLMSRLMQFGGNQISEMVAAMLTLQPAEAEEEKIKMSDSVQPLVRQAISPLAREIRSSIDFFERQQECHISQAFACGGTACSPKILEFLSEEVGFQIEPWNPLSSLDISHFNGDGALLTSVGPSLAGAIGAAAAPFQDPA
jgi:type IV pilus assembly protein PilM